MARNDELTAILSGSLSAEMPTAVYVMQAGEAAVKIGISRNPSSRVRQIQNGQDRVVGVYWAVRLAHGDAKKIEALAHRLLRENGHICGNGEWYYIAPETAVGVIESQIKQLGCAFRADIKYGYDRR